MVLLHDGAWGADALGSWERVIPLLADHVHVIAPDLLGFGRTDKAVIFNRDRFEYRAQHVARLLAVLDVSEPAHFVGASFGGTLLLRTLVADPRCWSAASAVSIGGDGGVYRHPENFGKLLQYDGSLAAMQRTVGFLIEDGDEFERQVSRRQALAHKAGAYQALSSLRLDRLPDEEALPVASEEFPAGLASVAVPLMLVAGEGDDLLLPGWAEKLQAFAPQARVVRLPGRHSPNIDRPEQICELLLDFWADSWDASRLG